MGTLTNEQKQEWLTCAESTLYFVHTHCRLFNATDGDWTPFRLWPAQASTLKQFERSRQIVLLKARQLGLSWLVLSYMLWLMLFRPASIVAIFSRRAEDAEEMLDFRLKGIYRQLPDYMQVRSVDKDNQSHWILSNGSQAMAFPTTGGRGHTFAFALVDEADFQPDLPNLMTAVKPTIDAGGSMALISTVDKALPESRFKTIYRAAKRGKNEWTPIFLPWSARPDRTLQWYEAQKRDALANTGALDDLYQEYPATDTEALAPRTLDKRIAPTWIEACYSETEPRTVAGAPSLPGLEIYQPPQPGRKYVLGADPAEGNPASDDSALTVVDALTGEECAVLSGRYEPTTFGGHIKLISAYYNHAPALVERNNHGHAVILWLAEHARRVRLLHGHDWQPDGDRAKHLGWLSSKLGKALLYTECADHFKQNAQAQTKVLHSFATYMQLASIEGATLRAPEGQHDDRADAYALAQMGRVEAMTNRTAPLVQGKAKGWAA